MFFSFGQWVCLLMIIALCAAVIIPAWKSGGRR